MNGKKQHMNYNKFKYIYPPRPEIKLPPTAIEKYSDKGYLGQPKMNGSSMQIYTNGHVVITMNRHKDAILHKLDINELKSLHRGIGWMVLCGEYMNKNKKDEKNKSWNIKFVIFDILVYEGTHLLRTTFEERYKLLMELYPDNLTKPLLHEISKNCFRVHSITKEFKTTYDMITKYDMYEGLVLKKCSGKLENGTTPKNNTRTQLKCRKETKNYAF